MWSAAALAALAVIVTMCSVPRGVSNDLVEVYDGFYIGEVVPMPKQARYFDEYIPLASAGGQAEATVVIDASAPKQINLAAAELSAQVGLRLGRKNLTFVLPVATALPAHGNIIAVGLVRSAVVSRAAKAAGLSVPGDLKPEGYWLAAANRSGRWIVVVAGADPLGAYYGAQSLLQLTTARDGAVVLRRAEILDWPDFRIRAHQFDGGFPDPQTARRALKWAAKFKLNQLGFGQAYDRPMQWRELTDQQKQSTEYICRRAAAAGVVRACFYPHPHRSKPEFNIRISDPADMDALVNICSFALERGAGGIMLRSDDIWPLAEEDQKRFGDHAAAHIYLVNQLYKRLRARWPNMVFMFCPPHYTNATIRGRKGGVDYIKRLGKSIPRDVLVIWTGPVTRSLEIKPADVDFIVDLLGRGPLLWDNTVYAHRSRYGYDPRHPHYFLDTFATKYPADFYRRVPGVTYNWNMSNKLALVAGIQTADCTWNLGAYDPEKSFRRAAAMVFGPAAVDRLIALRDAYYQIFDAVTSGRTLSESDKIIAADQRMKEILAALKGKVPPEPYEALAKAVKRMSNMADGARLIERKLQAAHKSLLVDLPPADGKWQIRTEGAWEVKLTGGAIEISYPWGTPSKAGAHGAASRTVRLPASPTGRYYLVFSCWDDYSRAGTPPSAWPGYLFKQALVDGEVVWEDDVEGREPTDAEAVHVVDITDRVRGRKQITIAFRGLDRRGVYNMGARMVFGRPMIIAGPATLVSVRAEVPGAEALNPQQALTVWVEFELAEVGRRQALFDKATSHRYFGFVHEDGHAVVGVFIDGVEYSAGGGTKLSPGLHTVALVYDGAQVKLYVDGKLDGARQASGRVRPRRGNLHFGQYAGGSIPIHGKILAAGVWRRALDEQGLAAIAQGQTPTADIAGFWRIPDDAWIIPPEAGDAPACTVYRLYELKSNR